MTVSRNAIGSTASLTPHPTLGGSHCAGVGCAHDGLGAEPLLVPLSRVTARHRESTTGRRRGSELPAHRAASRAVHRIANEESL